MLSCEHMFTSSNCILVAHPSQPVKAHTILLTAAFPERMSYVASTGTRRITSCSLHSITIFCIPNNFLQYNRKYPQPWDVSLETIRRFPGKPGVKLCILMISKITCSIPSRRTRQHVAHSTGNSEYTRRGISAVPRVGCWQREMMTFSPEGENRKRIERFCLHPFRAEFCIAETFY